MSQNFARLRTTSLAILVVSCSVSLPTGARAEPTESAAAQALFDQGKQLMATGKYADACPRLEESQRLDPALGTLLNLADCYEKGGRLASAWTRFAEAEGMARSGGHAEAQRVARDRAAKLAVRLSRLVIEVPASALAPGLEVQRDGVVVGQAQWGAAIPVDGGEHTVVATAPSRRRWQMRVSVAPSGATQRVQLPALQADPTATPATPATPATAPSSHPSAAASSPRAVGPSGLAPSSAVASGIPSPSAGLGAEGQPLGPARTLALVAGGVGLAGIAVGTVFGLQSKAKHDEALDGHCVGALCSDQTGIDLKEDALRAGSIATVGFVVGAAGLAGAALLWFAVKPTAAPVTIGAGPNAWMVRGTW